MVLEIVDEESLGERLDSVISVKDHQARKIFSEYIIIYLSFHYYLRQHQRPISFLVDFNCMIYLNVYECTQGKSLFLFN